MKALVKALMKVLKKLPVKISMGELKGKVIARFEDGMPIEEIALKSHVSVDEVTEILKEKKLITE